LLGAPRRIHANPIGECDLLYRNGALYLYATVSVPDAPMNEEPAGFLGVDLGIVNIATMSDSTRWSGAEINRVRHRNRRLRGKLQQKGTRSAKRLLAKRSGREARFAADANHRISKKIVAEAERTGHGIALEYLEGIRDRVRSRKPQRATLHSWSFHQLGSFIDYKAVRAGVPVVYVDPAYTSQQCSGCGHTHKKNRPNQATFLCTSCGLSLPADWNAAINIAMRGEDDWPVIHAVPRNTGLAAQSMGPCPSGDLTSVSPNGPLNSGDLQARPIGAEKLTDNGWNALTATTLISSHTRPVDPPALITRTQLGSSSARATDSRAVTSDS